MIALYLSLATLAGVAHAADLHAPDVLSDDGDEGEGALLGPVGPTDDPADPIINGEPASEDEYPQAGAMIIDFDLTIDGYGTYSLRTFTCSSTLIAPDVVMLAAHCIDELSYTQGQGSMTINEIRWTRQADLEDWDGTSMRKSDWPADSVAAADWMENEDFNLRRMKTGIAENHDIALLFLDTPVLDTPFAYVPTTDEGDQLAEGAPVTIVGWGQQEASDSPYDAPAKGTYAIKYMGDTVVGELGDAEFQVGPEESDARKCHGDSGGPTFIRVSTDSSETLRVVGVTSHSYDLTDCDSKGGVDTRVMALRDWVDDQMTQRCEDGTRVWCDEPGLPVPPEPVAEVDDSGSPDSGEEKGRACACSSGSASTTAPWAMGLLGLAMLRRRKVNAQA